MKKIFKIRSLVMTCDPPLSEKFLNKIAFLCKKNYLQLIFIFQFCILGKNGTVVPNCIFANQKLKRPPNVLFALQTYFEKRKIIITKTIRSDIIEFILKHSNWTSADVEKTVDVYLRYH